MNKYLSLGKALFFSMMILTITDVFAWDLNSVRVGSLEPNCSGANTSAHFYIPNSVASLTYYPRDIFYTSTLSIITNNTEIGIYEGTANYFGSSCTNWSRPANIALWDSSGYVIASNYDGCIFGKQKPTVAGAPIAQIVYKPHYKEETGLGVGTSFYTFAPEFIGGIMNPGITAFPLPNQTQRTWTPEKIHSNECRSYFVSYCGDWVLDNQTFDNGVTVNESCDLGAQNGQPGVACSVTCTSTVIPPVTPPGGGLTCTPGNFTRDAGGTVPAPVSATTPGLCPASEAVGNFTDTITGSSHRYAWSCNTISAGLACVAFYSPGGGGTPTPTTPTVITIPGSGSYCWNGVVERPNAAGQYENCDTTALWCQSCNIVNTTPGSVFPGKLTITTPGRSSIDINAFKLIIGNQVPVFSASDSVAFETTNPMYLENKTATITNRTPSLIRGTTVSKIIPDTGIGGMIRFETGRTHDVSGNLLTITYDQRIYPNTFKLFDGSVLQGFKGNTSNIVSGNSYENTNMTLPMSIGRWLYASLQYLEAPFNIRVSKPIIGNAAGWSAFIGSPLGYSVNTVTESFMNNLRSGNFTTSTVNISSSYALSSATRSVSDDNALSQTIASGSTIEEWRIANSSKNSSGIHAITSIASDFEIDSKSTKLGDTAMIRVFKDGDVSIDGNLNISWVKTLIIENGNLIINKDINYADKGSSFAWIVKNGNIIIADGVRNIAWVYVTLAGSIESNGVSTPNRLTVDGSLYGNTADLITHRSYVRGQMDYSALNVWVVVNYSNRAIMSPPPFLSRFLDQYSLQRVAK